MRTLRGKLSLIVESSDTKKVGLYKSATNDVAAVKGTVWGAKREVPGLLTLTIH